MSKLDFASLLCSRLCHDLVSPVGAINNGLEILEEEQDDAMKQDVMDLITTSTRQTAHKLQFFRLAFGAGGGFSQQIDIDEAEKALKAFLSGTKVTLEWRVTVSSVSKNAVKLLLNLGLTASETLIKGGSLLVEVSEATNNIVMHVTASGERIILQEVISKALTDELSEDELEPRSAPAYLANEIIKETGGEILIKNANDKSFTVQAVILSGK